MEETWSLEILLKQALKLVAKHGLFFYSEVPETLLQAPATFVYTLFLSSRILL
jgi:hypothetical protein